MEKNNIIENQKLEIKELKKILHEKKQEIKSLEKRRKKHIETTKQNMAISSILFMLIILVHLMLGHIETISLFVKYCLLYIISSTIVCTSINKIQKNKCSKKKKALIPINNELKIKMKELEILKTNNESKKLVEQETKKYSYTYTKNQEPIKQEISNENLTLKKIPNTKN